MFNDGFDAIVSHQSSIFPELKPTICYELGGWSGREVGGFLTTYRAKTQTNTQPPSSLLSTKTHKLQAFKGENAPARLHFCHLQEVRSMCAQTKCQSGAAATNGNLSALPDRRICDLFARQTLPSKVIALKLTKMLSSWKQPACVSIRAKKRFISHLEINRPHPWMFELFESSFLSDFKHFFMFFFFTHNADRV